MKNAFFWTLFLVGISGYSSIAWGQSIRFDLDTLYVEPTAEIQFQMRVDTSFNPIRGAQFSLQWDPNVIQYERFVSELEGFIINDRITDSGSIGLVWNLGVGEQLGFKDRTPLFQLVFRVIGELNDSTSIEISDLPVAPIFVGCCSADTTDPIFPLQRFEFERTAGLVKILSPIAIEAPTLLANCADERIPSFRPTISGAVDPLQYQWQGPNDLTANTPIIENIIPGIYYLTITDATGRELRDTYNINSPPPLEVDLQIDPSRCDRPTGMMRIGISGGTPDYSLNFNEENITDTIIAGLAPGHYDLRIQDANNCVLDTTVSIIEPQSSDRFIEVSDTTLCSGDTTFLRVDGPETPNVLWFRNGEPVGLARPVLPVAESGQYHFQMIDPFGCMVSDTTQLTFNSGPPQNFIVPDTIQGCAGEMILLNPGLGEQYIYQWSTGEDEATLPVMESGIYHLLLQSIGSDCFSSDTVAVILHALPEVDLPGTETVCMGDSLQIGIIEEPGVLYLWSTGARTSEIFVDEGGLYTLSATNGMGCSRSDSIEVLAIEDSPITISGVDSLVCTGQELMLFAEGGQTYEWIDTTGTLQLENEAGSVVTLTIFDHTQITLIADRGCQMDTISQSLLATSTMADAGRDTCIGVGVTFELNATGAVSYFWYDATFPVSDPTIANPTIQPDEATTYVVDMVDDHGCMVTDSVYIAVADDPVTFLMPVNVITPNNDGFNDYLEFNQLEKFDQVKLSIYNRWGDKIYEKLAYQKDEERWDGRYKGQDLPDGAYFYVLQVDDSIIKQTITLIR